MVKVSRQSTSRLIQRIPPQRTFFCFREAKSVLADLSLSQGSLKKILQGVLQTINKNESVAALRWKMDRCKKFIGISSD
jgi:D-aminopeptidase